MLDRVTLGAQSCHLGGLEGPFWHPGDHLGDPGVPGDTPQDTLGSRSGFVLILGGFWDPPWEQFWSLGTYLEPQEAQNVANMRHSLRDCFRIAF